MKMGSFMLCRANLYGSKYFLLPLKIDNFQYDDKTEVEEVQKMMKAMQIGLYEYYGSINRFGVDDKGAVLLAAFGLPPFGADDDAAKGLKAAKLLIAELQKIGYSFLYDRKRNHVPPLHNSVSGDQFDIFVA